MASWLVCRGSILCDTIREHSHRTLSEYHVPRLPTCTESSLSEDTLSALEPARMNGKLADVYLQFANSQPALRAYLVMEEALRAGSLSERERECIKLLVSEMTQCEYCLSVHAFKSEKAGLDHETQIKIRRAVETGDQKLDMLVRLVAHLFKQPGALSDELFHEARKSGWTDENLVDICMAMSTIFFTNITNHINVSVSSLPPAPKLT